MRLGLATNSKVGRAVQTIGRLEGAGMQSQGFRYAVIRGAALFTGASDPAMIEMRSPPSSPFHSHVPGHSFSKVAASWLHVFMLLETSTTS